MGKKSIFSETHKIRSFLYPINFYRRREQSKLEMKVQRTQNNRPVSFSQADQFSSYISPNGSISLYGSL